MQGKSNGSVLTRKHVEIIPSDYDVDGPFVLQEEILGIKGKALNLAYAGCMARYRTLLRAGLTKETCVNDVEDWYTLTLLSLLVTYENTVAVNARKRLLQWHRESVEHFLGKNALVQELRLLNILFCSPLPKQTKSPMLWQHRRWLFAQSMFLQSSIVIYGPSTYRETFQPSADFGILELNIVIRAGELHPKNYYAWSYARTLIQDHVLHPCDELAQLVFNLCKRHVSDISMWCFFDYILAHMTFSTRAKYISQVRELESIAPGHETLSWFFHNQARHNNSLSKYL